MEYQQDIFYDIEVLPYEKRMKLIFEAILRSEDVFVDKLVGWSRKDQPNVNPLEWIENTMVKDSMVRFIHRKGYHDPWFVQIAIREYGEFLWINLNLDLLDHFVEKYKLESL